jgi:hypothetical protein
MPVERLKVRPRCRHTNIIVADIIAGAIAADAEVGARRADQFLDLR